ncbi:hypothetical protein SAMN05877753_104457 [Bacillus oleivorans]|uniref:Uncharacterized protein n=1 Tax=Bacillus oleivorans TaxID=1448271 RepID=A0A285CVA2_9BACI|nr:hypothetical protein SAMN05877753_104457 [Bacillus oleivorans]
MNKETTRKAAGLLDMVKQPFSMFNDFIAEPVF